MKQVTLKKNPIPLLFLYGIVVLFWALYPTSFTVAKTIHIVAIISWFAGLFYLPRLFVYHAESKEVEVHKTFKVMEWKLFHYIMKPASIISIFTGVWMVSIWGWQLPIWLHIKFCLVLVLFTFHLYCGKLVTIFNTDNNQRSGKFYRILNEVPTLLLIAIVYLVVCKPLS